MRNNQKGFGMIEGMLILVILGLIGFAGWFAYHRQNTNQHPNQLGDSSAAWINEKLSNIKLSLQYPPTWRVTSNDGTYFTIQSPDNFELGILDLNSSFNNTSNNASPDAVVKEAFDIKGIGTEVVYAPNAETKPYHSITVVSRPYKIGDPFGTGNGGLIKNPSVNDSYLTINGGYTNGFDNQQEFDSKDSVKQAKLILQSLKFY